MKGERRPSEGYVFYKNLGEFGDELHWGMVKRQAESYFDQLDFSDPITKNVVNFVRSAAEAERRKEQELLSTYLGCSGLIKKGLLETDLIYILTTNFGFAEEAKRMIELIKSEEGVGGDHHLFVPKMAAAHLWKTVEPAITRFSKDKEAMATLEGLVMDNDIAPFELMWDKYMTPAVTEGVENMMRAVATDMKTQPEEIRGFWGEMLIYYQEVEDFRANVDNTLYSRFGIDKVGQYVKKFLKDPMIAEFGSGGSVAKLFREEVTTNLKGKMEKGRDIVGGFLFEVLNEATERTFLKKGHKFIDTDVKVKMNVKRTSGVSSGDLWRVISKINTEIELDMLDEVPKNKVEAFHVTEDFMEKMKEQEDVSIIYETDKFYQLEGGPNKKSFSGFRGSGMNLKSAMQMLDLIGYEHADLLLNRIKQTAEGAILDKERSEVAIHTSRTLAQYIAHFLFDDWTTVGKDPKGGLNNIHVFNLSYIMIPLSWMLFKLADAMENALDKVHRMVNIEIKGVAPVFYQEGQEGGGYPQKDQRWQTSVERWERQAELAEKATLSVTFLKDFRALLQEEFKGFDWI